MEGKGKEWRPTVLAGTLLNVKANVFFAPPPAPAPYRLRWRPAMGQTPVEHGEPNDINRVVHGAIFLGGIMLGVLAYPYRESALGTMMIGAAGSMAGVSLAFLITDLLGTRPF